MPELRAIVAAVLGALLAGCASLLPRGVQEVESPWHSFEDARDTIEKIVPDRTTAAELRDLAIDPYANSNVQLLTYSDILLRFQGAGSVPEAVDSGLRRCLEAGKGCTGYAIAVKEIHHDRVGNFWLDTLGFKRVTDVHGWSFNALILLVDGRVVYTLYGGHSNVKEQEVARQPLGPVQSLGDAVPSVWH